MKKERYGANMKKSIAYLVTMVLTISVLTMTGCGKTEDPGTPPAEVVNQEGTDTSESEISYDGSSMENAVTIRIGQGNTTEHAVTMYNNAAVHTMLDYLSDDETLFPANIYEEEEGFAAQNIRGTYSRDDETMVTDIKAGELYLFGDGQLRLYFRDITGANVTATPIGFVEDATDITEAVEEDYAANEEDPWGVKVYFQITKNL
ncbi:MAG: hypothetical protein EOM40_16890 [Clostridia bacterium]|nr:hypothetical protein [Clostridia bacterium]NCC44783.1 hypothetical protein [Clostridia bacterium]